MRCTIMPSARQASQIDRIEHVIGKVAAAANVALDRADVGVPNLIHDRVIRRSGAGDLGGQTAVMLATSSQARPARTGQVSRCLPYEIEISRTWPA